MLSQIGFVATANETIYQVLSMYDHVNEFKEKLIDILLEIQGMGVGSLSVF